MPLDLARMRPAYNGTALATACLVTGPYWAHALTSSTSGGPLAPLGLTIAGLIPTALLDRTRYADRDGNRHDWWVPRVLVWTVAVAGPGLCAAAHAPVLQFLIGGQS
ncbi:hypothetical protein LN042_11470 [Kitasatospora sp. RB6PN24]|uniref:hypothetical protein n=1 Tax=Kitasatospora humi TaxID=2893891 RepID=UPI001E611C66|nr:hypothetical protein [Kitasatospora humi]MCC9307708.1 hypothetical protein [Kitasatospora humi]